MKIKLSLRAFQRLSPYIYKKIRLILWSIFVPFLIKVTATQVLVHAVGVLIAVGVGQTEDAEDEEGVQQQFKEDAL